jgi:hypothetical protein
MTPVCIDRPDRQYGSSMEDMKALLQLQNFERLKQLSNVDRIVWIWQKITLKWAPRNPQPTLLKGQPLKGSFAFLRPHHRWCCLQQQFLQHMERLVSRFHRPHQT